MMVVVLSWIELSLLIVGKCEDGEGRSSGKGQDSVSGA